jgi:glycosyltransferase involved in cell wall biosynthesis
VVLTPNLSGRDGVSRLARLATGAFDEAIVIALHEPAATTTFGRAQVRGGGGRSSRFVAAALRVAAACDARTTVVVIHLHLAPAALAFAARGASLVTMLCGVEAWRPATWLQRAALDRAERLVAISRFTRERFLEVNPRFAGRTIDVCHLGVEAASGAGVVADGPPSALIVGRMAADERYKGHDELIEIWPEVAAAVPSAVLRIVGDGDDRPRLEAKAAALDLGPRIVFAGGLDDEALRREFAGCTAFVMPSRDEGFGFVFVEAMRAGRPCVGARGAAGEIIVDGDTGWLVAPGDRSGLSDALVRMLSDRAAADTMGARGRVRFLQHFTEERFRERFTALLPLAAPAVTA